MNWSSGVRRVGVVASVGILAGHASAQPQLLMKVLPHSSTSQFGRDVAVWERHLAVGVDAWRVFVHDADTGEKLYELAPSSSSAFGEAVAVDSRTLVVGAPNDGTQALGAGAVYVFEVATGKPRFVLHAPDAGAGDSFGRSVAVEGRLALIGADRDDDRGAAYVFDVDTGVQLYKVTASDGLPGDRFGYSCKIADGVGVIGAPAHDTSSARPGAAYVFDLATGQELRKLTPSDGEPDDAFGFEVALRGTSIAVGAIWADGTIAYQGTVYMFDAVTGAESWSSTTVGTHLGHSMHVGETTVVVGGEFQTYLLDRATGHLLTPMQDVAIVGSRVAVRGDRVYTADWHSGPGVQDAICVFDIAPPSMKVGTACPGPFATAPSLVVEGELEPGGGARVRVEHPSGGAAAIVLLGGSLAVSGLGGGCFQYVSPQAAVLLGPVVIDSSGTGKLRLGIPPTLSTPSSVVFQAFIYDTSGALEYGVTNGVQVTVR